MTAFAHYLSCEHAVNTLPGEFMALREQFGERLQTHEAYDIGAQLVARHLAGMLQCPLTEASVSRLLIDCNRSLTHRNCFSDVSRTLSAAKKNTLISAYYHPYREKVTSDIAALIQAEKRVLHLSMHSFTPELHGKVRTNAIGLLYDPSRPSEKQFAITLQQALAQKLPDVCIRRNTPYRGNSDGLTRSLRQRFKDADYLGIEIEFNQKASMSEMLCWSNALGSILTSCGA